MADARADPVQELFNEICQLSHSMQIHPFSNIGRIVDSYVRAGDQALANDELYPYSVEGLQALINLGRLNVAVTMGVPVLPAIYCQHPFIFQAPDDRQQAMNDVFRHIGTLGRQMRAFEERREAIAKDIRLRVLRNPVVDDIVLASARVIVPCDDGGRKRYLLYGARTKQESGKSTNVCDTELTAIGEHPSVASAINACGNLLTTIIVAHNAENYKLNQTALPVILYKYVLMLGNQSRKTPELE